MTGERRPLLAFGPPAVGSRAVQPRTSFPRPQGPGSARQGERLTPQFRELSGAFDAERVRVAPDTPDEVDPALVVVLDLAGSIKNFKNAIDKIEGLEFLAELVGEQAVADDDFFMEQPGEGRTADHVPHSLYLIMSNAIAIDELIRLFALWQEDQTITFDRGLGRFKEAFAHLTAIRRRGAEDRTRETGLLESWRETLAVVGQSASTVLVEVELWYRRDAATRSAAQDAVEQIIASSGGSVVDRSDIADISYHALLAEIPIQQVEKVLRDGAASVQLLSTDAVMFVSPFLPMTVVPPSDELTAPAEIARAERLETLPRIALFDGLPFVNHDALAGRLVVDDPDELGVNYPVVSRAHGTAMASLILHGDLSAGAAPLDRPLYVRPIMRPHDLQPMAEQVVPNRLLPDLLHRAVRRMLEGEGGRTPAAPSVRIVNLSIGAQARGLTRRMSAVGRLLDWLALTYNLLFVVSAGNYAAPIVIPAADAADSDSARAAAARRIFDNSLLRGVLPPGDAMNALTVGATHADAFGPLSLPSGVWDVTHADGQALYGATGPGVDRSIKPDIHHTGGRVLFREPSVPREAATASLEIVNAPATGPGIQVAAPGRSGATNATSYTFGTSNATALVSREASRLFDVLETPQTDRDDAALPNAQYHPLLVRALLAHASSWGDWDNRLRTNLSLDNQNARRKLTALLGYGRLDTSRLGNAATNRAVLVAGGEIGSDQRHTYDLPLPVSLRARADWHRFTITLAYTAPTVGRLTRYRGAKVFFATPDMRLAAGNRIEADDRAVRRGSLQQEIIDGSRAMTFTDGTAFPIHVECMDDAVHLPANSRVRYALVVSVETAVETSTTIYEEVRAAIRARTQDRVRSQAQA